jgi:ornithine--oxo-acid transaminase
METQEYIALEDQYNARNYQPLDVVLERGEGIWVWDVEGNRYLDCLSAYSALNQGHAHPRVRKAMIEQAAKLTLTGRAFRNDQLPLLAKELCELTGYEMMLPMNTGAEAVETALKAARKWGYEVKGVPDSQAEIITCAGNFHGRTITIVGFSTEAQYKEGFGPFTPGFLTIPYGDVHALEAAITPNTVAFMVEPIQGEGGVYVPPAGYLKQARDTDRSRPHRAALRLRLGRRAARPGDHRQGSLGWFLSRLSSARRPAGAGPLHPRRPRLHVRRQSPGRSHRSRGAQGFDRRGTHPKRSSSGRIPAG